MGFALQLCALRYPGRLLASGEAIPIEVLRLEPLSEVAKAKNQEWAIRTASFDLEADKTIDTLEEKVAVDCIVIVEGSFLLRTKLRDLWDYTIFLDVDREVATERGAQRDAEQLDGVKDARRLHDERYQAACDLYVQEEQPHEIADVIVQNEQFDKPTLMFRQNMP